MGIPVRVDVTAGASTCNFIDVERHSRAEGMFISMRVGGEGAWLSEVQLSELIRVLLRMRGGDLADREVVEEVVDEGAPRLVDAVEEAIGHASCALFNLSGETNARIVEGGDTTVLLEAERSVRAIAAALARLRNAR